MFLNWLFWIMVVVLAALPLSIAILAPETIKMKIILSIIVIAVCLGTVFIELNEVKTADEEYNNSICTECGGHFEFSGGSQYKSHHEYYYTCDNCGHTIITNHVMG
jgi:DNA-directed RNA polymerase subunit RPC12/RpoP